MTNKRNGVSLVELAIAASLFALMMLPVFLAFTSGNRNLKVTNSEFMAHTAAIEIMEQIISLPYDRIPLGHFVGNQVKTGKFMGNSDIPFKITDRKGYVADVLIESLKKNGKDKYKKLSVTITFPEMTGSKKDRKVTLKTLVANEKG